MKPWEQTWDIRRDQAGKLVAHFPGEGIGGGWCLPTDEQTVLAAAAPQLYRALSAMVQHEEAQNRAMGGHADKRLQAAWHALKDARGEGPKVPGDPADCPCGCGGFLWKHIRNRSARP